MTLISAFILFFRYINSIFSEVVSCMNCNNYVKMNEAQKTILRDDYSQGIVCHKCLGKNNDIAYYKLIGVAIAIDLMLYLIIK